MKTIFMAFLAVFILWACDRETETTPVIDNSDGTELLFSFISSDGAFSKAFGDAVSTNAEKKINRCIFYIFKKNGDRIFKKELLSTELNNITTTPVSIKVPGLQKDSTYKCYAVINEFFSDAEINNLNELGAVIKNNIAAHNGKWSEVKDDVLQARIFSGFSMVGNKNLILTDLISPQNVTIPVSRITAKVDVQVTLDLIPPYNTGVWKIDSVKLNKAQATTPLLLKIPTTNVGTLTFSQASNMLNATNFQNRFYVFENGPMPTANWMNMDIFGTYNGALVKYNIPLNPCPTGTDCGAGRFNRNGAYLIKVFVKGPEATQLNLLVNVQDWATICTQPYIVGQ
ncbi:MAG: hypothetical protein RR137_08575 [Odoribacter sp.]